MGSSELTLFLIFFYGGFFCILIANYIDLDDMILYGDNGFVMLRLIKNIEKIDNNACRSQTITNPF